MTDRSLTTPTSSRGAKNARALLPLLAHPGRIWRYIRDRKAPKALLVFALAYVVMPLDLIPDFEPIVTWLDDMGVVALALSFIMNRASKHAEEAAELEAAATEAAQLEASAPTPAEDLS